MTSLLGSNQLGGQFIGEAFGKTDAVAETHEHAGNFRK